MILFFTYFILCYQKRYDKPMTKQKRNISAFHLQCRRLYNFCVRLILLIEFVQTPLPLMAVDSKKRRENLAAFMLPFYLFEKIITGKRRCIFIIKKYLVKSISCIRIKCFVINKSLCCIINIACNSFAVNDELLAVHRYLCI